jgi:glycosyltransferase involved in cell wall biosynthesis
LKVAITVPWGERLGGAETMLWTLLRNLDRTRVDPTVVFFQPGRYNRDVEGLGIRTAVIRAGRLRQPVNFARTVRAIARLLRRERCDLVLNWSAKTHLYGGVGAALVGMAGRTVWWQHGLPDGGWMDRAAAAVPARAVGCSSAAAAQAQRKLKPGLPAFVVYPGIDAPPQTSFSELARLRARLQLPAEALVLGVVGRLQPWKRQDLMIKAVAELRRRGRAVHGLLVGGDAYGLSPGYSESLPRLAEKLGVARHVTFTGQVDDATPYMELMDVVLSTSSSEPFGIVLIEAMALAKPVVAFASAGPLEIVRPGVTGLLLPESGGSRALVGAVDRLLDDSNLRESLGVAARRRFLERFTADRMSRSLVDQLELVTSSRQ